MIGSEGYNSNLEAAGNLRGFTEAPFSEILENDVRL